MEFFFDHHIAHPMTALSPQTPIDQLDLDTLARGVINITRQAGELLVVYYNQHLTTGIEVNKKEDTSPVTAADMASHQLISQGLRALYDIPVLSEESVDVSARHQWQRFWLVDPLDGTKEFLKKNGEFTVNIALVEAGRVVLGAIGVPLKQDVYLALHETTRMPVLKTAYLVNAQDQRITLTGHQLQGKVLRTAMSRSALDNSDYRPYVEQLTRAGWQLDTVNAGSAYKFCLMALGGIDFYPRLHPTSEWDTASGQCLLEVLGGALVDLQGRAFTYNQRDRLLNGSFIAVTDSALLPDVLPTR